MSKSTSRFVQPLTSPYPGLRPFQPHETEIFFGRDEHVAEMLTVLEDHRFLAVVGPSGGGKSSLVLAGLLPALERGELFTARSSDWRFIILRPGDAPYRNLATAVQEKLASDVGHTADAEGSMTGATAVAPVFHDGNPQLTELVLRSSPRGFVQTLQDAAIPESANVLVLVDQFEEIFRFRGAEQASSDGQAAERRNDAADFVQLLLATARQTQRPVYVLLTMRSDFLGECDVFDDLPQAINKGQYLTPRLSTRQLERAILCPPQLPRFGGSVEIDVVRRILNDVGTARDELPVVQHALYCAWNHAVARRAPETLGAVLSLDDYQQTGGLQDALSREADRALDECRERGLERVVERVFRGLVKRGASGLHVRRPVTVQELADEAGATCEEVVEVVETFRREDRSFLMPPASSVKTLTPATKIDISHESLIRQWKRLRDEWLPVEDEAAATFHRILEAATLESQKEGSLWRPPELDAARKWWSAFAPTVSWSRRYSSAASPEDAAARFRLASEFLDNSVTAWRKQADAEEQRRIMETKLLEQRADAEARRAEAERQRAESELAGNEQKQKLIRVLSGILAAAFLLAGVAIYFKSKADASATKARMAASKARDAQAKTQSLLNESHVAAALEAFQMGYPKRGYEILRECQPKGLGWEWSYSQAFLDLRFQPIFPKHFRLDFEQKLPEGVADLVFSPDGKRLAAIGTQGTVAAWDAERGDEAAVFRWSDVTSNRYGLSATRRIVYTSDGTRLLVCYGNQLLIFEIPESGPKLDPKRIGFRGWVSHCSPSRDGRTAWLVLHAEQNAKKGESASPTEDQIVQIDLVTREQTQLAVRGKGTRSELGAIQQLALHPNDRWLVAVFQRRSESPQVGIWDRQGKLLGGTDESYQRSLSDKSITDLAVYPSGTFLTLAASDGEIIGAGIVPKLNGRVELAVDRLRPGQLGRSYSNYARFAGPNAEWIVQSEKNGALAWIDLYAIRDFHADLPIVGRAAGAGRSVSVLSVAPHGRSIATADSEGNISLWRTMPQWPGGYDVAVAQQTATVTINADGSREASLPNDKTMAVAISSDGSRVATTSSSGVSVWDAVSGWSVDAIGWKELLSGSRDLDRPTQSGALPKADSPIADRIEPLVAVALALSPDGTELAVAYNTMLVRWDVSGRKRKGHYQESRDRNIVGLEFSPDGKRLAIGHDDSTATTRTDEPQDAKWLVWRLDESWPAAQSPRDATSLAFHPFRDEALVGGSSLGIKQVNLALSSAQQPADVRAFSSVGPSDESRLWKHIDNIVFDRNGESAFFTTLGSSNAGKVWQLDLKTRRFQPLTESPASSAQRLIFLPANDASGNYQVPRLGVLTQGELRICATDNGRDLLRLRGPQGDLVDVVTDARGKRLVALQKSGRVFVWQAADLSSAEQLTRVVPQVDKVLDESLSAPDTLTRLQNNFQASPQDLELALSLLRNRQVTLGRIIDWACENLPMEGLAPATIESVARRVKTLRDANPEDPLFRLLYDVVLVQQAADPRQKMKAAEAIRDLDDMNAKELPPDMELLRQSVRTLAHHRTGDFDRAIELMVANEGGGTGSQDVAQFQPKTKGVATNPRWGQGLTAAEAQARRHMFADPGEGDDRPWETPVSHLARALNVAVRSQNQYRVNLRLAPVEVNQEGDRITAVVTAEVQCSTAALAENLRKSSVIQLRMDGQDAGILQEPAIRPDGDMHVVSWKMSSVAIQNPICRIDVSLRDPITKAVVQSDLSIEVPRSKWPNAWLQRPALYLVAIGATEVDPSLGQTHKLKAPLNDVKGLSHKFETQSNDFYRKGVWNTDLVGRAATHDAVMAALRSTLASAQEKDVVVFFFSGHGWERQQEGGSSRAELVLLAYDGFIAWEEIWKEFQMSRPCRRIVILDTSRAGLAAEHAARSPLDNCYLLLGANAQQNAMDYGLNGAFTLSILEGLQGKADLGKAGAAPDGQIRLDELADYVMRDVSLRESNQNPVIWPDISQWPRDVPLVTVPSKSGAPVGDE